METQEFVKQCTMGGPGLDGYTYRAAMYCIDCGREIVQEIATTIAPTIKDTCDPLFSDSETCPQPIFFGESEVEEHCDNCGQELPISVIS